MMKTLLDDFLSTGRIPLASGVWMRDGRFYSATHRKQTGKLPVDIVCMLAPLPLTTGEYATVSIFLSSNIQWSNWTITVGEGSYGEDGYVAVQDERLQVVWIAFFDFSNPFESARVVDNVVLASNNLNETWAFPLDEPWRIHVTRTQPGFID